MTAALPLRIAAALAGLVAAAHAPPTPAHAPAGGGHRPDQPRTTPCRDVPTGSPARLRGLAPVSARTAWVSGSGGTVLRTTDGGRTWADVSPPDAAGLEL